ncbi:MAG: NAD-dependent epimerase/dehydratase family protein [Veillonellales bacterium]
MRILITAKKSYVGLSLKTWLGQWPNKYRVDTMSSRNDEWRNIDFSQYDVLFHVAAFVHKKEEAKMEGNYYKVNRDLTISLARKAKQSGVKQFIFMSTVAVYGLVGKVKENIVINKDTPCLPTTFYGKSKLQAEKELEKLNDKCFHVAIIRSPMIYGPNCPGNYNRLKKFVMHVPVFPQINNQRSMIFIDNLSEFIRLLVINNEYGLFFPQNKEYVNTSEMVRLIMQEKSKRIYFSRIIAFGMNIEKYISIWNKVFGNLVIDHQLSSYKNVEYCVADFEQSIKICETKL